MSLKARLALTLGLAFLAILAIGGILTFEQASRNIRGELEAARSVAANRVAQLIAELPASRDTAADLSGFVRTFNGDRHVQVMLIDATGAVREASQPARPGWTLPAWFVDLFAPRASTTIMPLSGSALPMTAVVVSINPLNELADTWADLGLGLAILVAFILVAFMLVWVVADRALRPIAPIRAAFERIGSGDYATPVAPSGPPELQALAGGCNAMAERLEEISSRSRRLSEQLLRLQEEERADLARDLHDDIGPTLFAIDVDASAIERRARHGTDDAAFFAERASAIKKAAQRARLDVRRILSELRPGLMPGLGLKASLEDMLAELAVQHPSIEFPASLVEGDWGGRLEVLVHRAVREGVHNALRHGSPTRIATRLAIAGDALVFQVTDDGGGLPQGGAAGGYGLVGMRERIEAAGGHIAIVQVPLPPGVRLEGRIPLPAEAGIDPEPAAPSPDETASGARTAHEDGPDTDRSASRKLVS